MLLSFPDCEPRNRERQRLTGFDDLDPILIRVADEAEPVAAVAHRVRRALRLDPLLGETSKRSVEVVHADSDMSVGGAEAVSYTHLTLPTILRV